MNDLNSDTFDWREADAKLLKAGYAVVAFLFVFGGLWGGCAPLESAALAPGVLQVEGKRKAVQHLEGGIISQILVENGEEVVPDQPLISLDATRDRAELKILRGRIYNTEALVSRLEAERDSLTSIVWPPSLLDVSEDTRASEAVANEQALFEARFDDRNGEEELIRQVIQQKARQLTGLESLLTSKMRIISSVDSEMADLTDLLAEGYVDKQRLRELERLRAQHVGSSADLEAKISALRIAIQESELEIIQLNMRFKSDVVAQLSEEQARLFDLKEQYFAAADRVERATIKTPVAGIVLGLKKNTLGAVIAPGEQLLELVPRVKKLMVEAKVSPMDIDRIQLGQSAEVRFSVFKDAYTVTGSLTKISADTLVDELTGSNYYAAQIDLVEEDLMLLGGLSLLPGMPADVLIKTGNRTMLGYLSSPLNRMFARSLIEE